MKFLCEDGYKNFDWWTRLLDILCDPSSRIFLMVLMKLDAFKFTNTKKSAIVTIADQNHDYLTCWQGYAKLFVKKSPNFSPFTMSPTASCTNHSFLSGCPSTSFARFCTLRFLAFPKSKDCNKSIRFSDVFNEYSKIRCQNTERYSVRWVLEMTGTMRRQYLARCLATQGGSLWNR